MEQLYVIQCEKGKYYVGKTADVMRRYEEHKTGKGSAWTRKYKPINLIECRPLKDEHDENNVTKNYMRNHGIEHVRGGTFTQIVLPDAVVSVLQMEIRGNADMCYKCNLAGHFANRCPNDAPASAPKPKTNEVEEWGCDYCDRTFTTRYGCSVHERSCKKNVEEVEEQRVYVCYKCGRSGHKSPDCYARTHVDGYSIGSVSIKL
jgi:predicted GIY-YIG superfamily endonuclease